jgi:hypothetical protein
VILERETFNVEFDNDVAQASIVIASLGHLLIDEIRQSHFLDLRNRKKPEERSFLGEL